MKINGLGAEQIAAMAMLAQAKKSSEKKDSPAFGIMMEAVLAGTKNNFNNKSDEGSSSQMENLKPSVNINTVSAVTEGKSEAERINDAVLKAAKKYGVDKDLINAIIKIESDFNPKTVSSAGAKGLMQLMSFNFEMLGVTDPFNIEQNIDGGTKLIKKYIDMYDGDVKMGLMAYNGGPTRMKNRGVKSPSDIYKMPKETQNYIDKIARHYPL